MVYVEEEGEPEQLRVTGTKEKESSRKQAWPAIGCYQLSNGRENRLIIETVIGFDHLFNLGIWTVLGQWQGERKSQDAGC